MVQQLQLNLGKWEKLYSSLSENKNVWINWKHLGEVHQSNQTLASCNSLIQLWATSNSLVQSWAIRNSSFEILVHLEMSGLTIEASFKFG